MTGQSDFKNALMKCVKPKTSWMTLASKNPFSDGLIERDRNE
jgi:hypothetical protein